MIATYSTADMLEKYSNSLPDLMNEVENILNNEGINHSTNSKRSEFVCDTIYENIHTKIMDSLSIPNNVARSVLSVKNSKKRTYIRQRVR